MAREQVQFTEVNMASLSVEQNDAWQMYLEAKKALGEALNANAPNGKRVVFTTKYNVLKVALVNKAKASDGKAKIDLGAWQAQRAQDGLSS